MADRQVAGVDAGMATAKASLNYIYLVAFVDAAGLGLIMPTIPDLLKSLGYADPEKSAELGGFLFASYAVAHVIFSPFVGRLSDYYGRRPVLLASMLCLSIDYMIMALAESVVWLFAGRIMSGVAGSLYAPAISYISDNSSHTDRTARIARVSGVMSLGYVISPALGGMLGEVSPRLPFVCAALFCGLSFWFGVVSLRESLPPEQRTPLSIHGLNPVGGLARLKDDPVILRLVVIMTFLMIARQVIPCTWAFFLSEKFRFSVLSIGLSIGLLGIFYALAQFYLTGRLVLRFGEGVTAILGIVAYALSLLGLAIVSEPWMLFALMIPLALEGLADTSLTSMASQRVGNERQGELQGRIASALNLGWVAGAVLMTKTYSYFSQSGSGQFRGAALLLASAIALGACLILFATFRKGRAE